MSYDVYFIFESNFVAKSVFQKMFYKYFANVKCYIKRDRCEAIFPIKRNWFQKILMKLKIKKYKYEKLRVRFLSKKSHQANIGIYKKYFIENTEDYLSILKIILKEYEKGETL